MNLLDPPIRNAVIECMSPRIARMYEVVPVTVGERRLTVATAKPLCDSARDELKTFLDFNTVDHVLVTHDQLIAALDHYYPDDPRRALDPNNCVIDVGLPNSIPVRQLYVRVMQMLIEPDVENVCISPLVDRTELFVDRYGSLDVRDDHFADAEHGEALLAHFKILANLNVTSRAPQCRQIELPLAGILVAFFVDTTFEDDREVMRLAFFCITE